MKIIKPGIGTTWVPGELTCIVCSAVFEPDISDLYSVYQEPTGDFRDPEGNISYVNCPECGYQVYAYAPKVVADRLPRKK